MVQMTKIYLNICLCIQLASCPHQPLNEKLVGYSTGQLQTHQTPELSVVILSSSSSVEEPVFKAVSTRFGQDQSRMLQEDLLPLPCNNEGLNS